MKNIKKGGASLKRPTHIRVFALLMAVVMVISVMIITNRNGKVQAEGEIIDNTYLATLNVSGETAYITHVPCGNIKFKIPKTLPENASVSEDTGVYTNGDGSAWSLTETAECNTPASVKKVTETVYAWDGDVETSGEDVTITSSDSGNKVASVKKTVTISYKKADDSVIDALSAAPEVTYPTTITLQYGAPSAISVADDTISDAYSVGDTSTEFYYGECRYTIDSDTTLLSKAAAESSISSNGDGDYSITQYIISENGEEKTLYTAAPVSYHKNQILITDTVISEEGTSNSVSKSYDGSLSLNNVNIADTVKVSFTTDIDNADVSVSPAVSVTNSGYDHSFSIPGKDEYNDSTQYYTVTVKDGTELTKTIEIAIHYGNGKPVISAEAVTVADSSGAEVFMDASKEQVTVSATVTAGLATIASATVECATNDSMSGAASKDATVNGDSISLDIPASELVEGNNYFRISATSSFGLSTTSTTILKVVKDSENPALTDPVLSQDGTDIADDTKITCNKDAVIKFSVSDADPSSGVSEIVVERENEGGSTESLGSFAPETDGSCVYTIAATSDNDGNSYTYKFTAYDNAGNASEVKTKKVSFFNDGTHTITREVLPAKDAENFVVWTDDTKIAIIDYKIDSEVDIDESKVTIALDEDAPINVSNDGDLKKIDNKHYQYSLSYGASKTVKNIVFSIETVNGSKETDTLPLLHIDVNAPQVGDTTAEDTIWRQSLIFSGNISDPQDGDEDAVSGLKSAKYTISNSVADTTETIDLTKSSTVSINIPESKDKNGTKLTFNITDNANNVNSNSYIYYIDNTDPVATLKIAGKKPKELKSYYLKSDPVITYSGSDKLSGLADTNGVVFKINGTTYTDVSGKKLSDIVGSTSDTAEYKVELTVTDKAGNTSTETAVFKVDDSVPEITVSKTAEGKYLNSNVTVKVQIKDSNLKDYTIKRNGKAVGVTLTKKSDTWSGSFVVDKKNYGNNKISVTAVDESGNTVTDESLSFVIDTKAPEVITQISKDGETWYDYNIEDPLDEFIKFYPYVRVKVKDDYEDTSVETVEMTYKPFDNSDGFSDTAQGKRYHLAAQKGNDEGQYWFDFVVKDKAGNDGVNVTGDLTAEDGVKDLSIGLSIDTTAPKHNLYITNDNPTNFSKYNNTYKNLVGKFKEKKNQENYKYGQFYSGKVTIDLSVYDNSILCNGDVTVMHKYKAPGETVATLYEDDEHVTYVGNYEWTEGASSHFKYNTIYVDEPGEHEIWLKSNDHEDPNDGIGGYNTKNDDVHLFFTIDTAAPTVGLYLNNSPYNSGAGNMYTTGVSAYASVFDYNLDYIVRNYTMTPPGGSAITSTLDNYENGTSESFETEADYTIDYTAYDKAGFSSGGTHTMSFRIDKTAPELTITGPGETTTDKSTVTFNLKEAFFADMPPAKITIYRRVDGAGESVYKSIDFKPNSANDSISHTFDEDGEYRMEFTAEDKTGNTSKAAYTFFQDADAPLITLGGVKNYDMTSSDVEFGVTVNETFYSTNNVKLSGTRTDIDGEKEVLSFENFPSNSSISTMKQNFTEDGIYDIKVTSKDKVGNESSEDIHFTIDKTSPLIGDIPIQDGSVMKEFTWSVDEDKLIKDLTVCDISVYIDGVLYDGVTAVEDGAHVLKVEATDEMGNKSSKEINFMIDSIAPNIMISGVEDGQKVEAAPNVNVSVQLEDDTLSSVTLDGKEMTISNNEASFTVNTKGNHKIEAKAVDKAGNEASVNLQFLYGSKASSTPIFLIGGIFILLVIAALVFYKLKNR